MKLRTSAAAAALALATALTLTACADDSGDSASPSASASSSPATEAPTPTKEDVAALKTVKVEGDAGKEPKVTFKSPLEVSVPTTRVIDEGKGAEVTEGTQVTIDFVGYLGSDGTSQGSTWQQKQPATFILGDQSYGVLTEPLTGQKVGARVLVAFPTQDQQGNAVTAVNLVEITDAKKIPTRAEGEAVKPAAGLPTVTLDDSGKPSVKIPDGYKAPKDLVAQTLIKGDGAKVKKTQTVTAHYTGWTLDGEQFDSSWDRGAPTSFSLQQVIKGWTDGLAGQTVGSQVLLVIPAEQAYGANPPQGSNIKADSPLVFVVDILAAQ